MRLRGRPLRIRLYWLDEKFENVEFGTVIDEKEKLLLRRLKELMNLNFELSDFDSNLVGLKFKRVIDSNFGRCFP